MVTFPSVCLSICLFVLFKHISSKKQQSDAVNGSLESLSTLVDPNRRGAVAVVVAAVVAAVAVVAAAVAAVAAAAAVGSSGSGSGH